MKDKFLICCIENEIDLAFDKWLKWSRVKLVHRAVKLCSLSLRARIFNNTLDGLAPSFGLVVNKRYLEFSSRILITNDLYLLRWGFQEISREQVDVFSQQNDKVLLGSNHAQKWNQLAERSISDDISRVDFHN